MARCRRRRTASSTKPPMVHQPIEKSHRLSRKAAQRRWESQPWEAWDSPETAAGAPSPYANLKTKSQPAPLYVGNRKAPKRFRTMCRAQHKAPYVLSTVTPSNTDGGSALTDEDVFFEDEQGGESEEDKITARRCIIRGAKLVDAAIRKRKRVLVHCYAGQNRSASICAAYLILYSGWTPSKAIKYVRHRVEVGREVLEVIDNAVFEQILKKLKPGSGKTK